MKYTGVNRIPKGDLWNMTPSSSCLITRGGTRPSPVGALSWAEGIEATLRYDIILSAFWQPSTDYIKGRACLYMLSKHGVLNSNPKTGQYTTRTKL
jgi:hypothetical protein